MSSAVPVLVPHETVNDETVRVLSWTLASGDPVRAEQMVGEVETSKVVLEIHAPSDGFLWYRHKPGDDVPVGAPLCFVTETQTAPGEWNAAAPSKNGAAAPPPDKALDADLPPARLTPLALRIAQELNLDIASFPRGSLIRKQDVLAKANPQAPPAPKFPAAKAPAPTQPAPQIQPASGVALHWDLLPKRKLAEARMLAGVAHAALPSLVMVSCSGNGFRAKLQAAAHAPSASAVIVFEAARLLKKYPFLNALSSDGHIGYYDEINIGYAIDGGEGLLVPVIRNADQKSPLQISSEIRAHVEAYVQRKTASESLSGGTFTISDLSEESVASFIPLISSGQSAILGVGSEQRGEFNLILAFDHRVAEGRSAAQFLKDLARRLEAYGQATDSAAADTTASLYCSVCNRPYSELQKLRAMLLKSVSPDGLICSICLTGY